MNQSTRLAYMIALSGMILAATFAGAQDKVRMGLSSVSGLHAAVWVAEQKGLFRKHGMTIVGFWQPLNTGMESTLIYLLAYKDGAARDAAWAAFRSDPEWTKVTKQMQVGSSVQSVFLNSTDYGPMK